VRISITEAMSRDLDKWFIHSFILFYKSVSK